MNDVAQVSAQNSPNSDLFQPNSDLVVAERSVAEVLLRNYCSTRRAVAAVPPSLIWRHPSSKDTPQNGRSGPTSLRIGVSLLRAGRDRVPSAWPTRRLSLSGSQASPAPTSKLSGASESPSDTKQAPTRCEMGPFVLGLMRTAVPPPWRDEADLAAALQSLPGRAIPGVSQISEFPPKSRSRT